MISENIIVDVSQRSWRGHWDRFGFILDAFSGSLGVPGNVLATFWMPFEFLWGSQGRPGTVLGVPWKVWGRAWKCLFGARPPRLG